MNESLDFDGAWRMQTSPLAGFSHLGDSDIHVGERVYDNNPAELGLLLTGLCGGCLDLFAFMVCLYHTRLSIRSLTVFQVSLTVSRILQLLSSLVMIMWYYGTPHCSNVYCCRLYLVWYASRRSGVILHLLAALEFMLRRQKLKIGPRLLHMHWTLPVVITVDLLCLLFYDVLEAAMFFGALVFSLTGLLSLLYFVCSHRSDQHVITVLLCAYFTFATYLPSFMIECLRFSDYFLPGAVYARCQAATNLHLIVDGYMCWVTSIEHQKTAQQPLEAGNVNLNRVSKIQTDVAEVWQSEEL